MAAAHAGAARHQQGHDGDVDLRPPHHPGRRVGAVPRAHARTCSRARTASTSGSSRTSACRTGRCSGRWTRTPGSSATPGGREEVEKQTKVLQLIHNYRVRGHLVADLDPLDRAPRAAPRPRPGDLRPHAVGPRPRVPDRRALRARTRRRCARSSTSCARPTAGRSASSTCTSPTPSGRSGCSTAWSRRRNYPALDAAKQEARPREARRGGELRALPPHQVRRPQALLARGRRGARSRCSTASSTTRRCGGCARS